MANKEIPELTAATVPLTGDELMHIVQDGNSRKVAAERGRGWASGVTAALAEGDLLYVNAAKELVRLPKGTANQVLYQNAAGTAPEWRAAVFTKFFESTQQTIVFNGLLTIAHGFGVKPKLPPSLRLYCVVAHGGFSVGDEIELSAGAQSTFAAADGNTSVWCDATNIYVRLPSRIDYGGKSSGLLVTLNATNWKLIALAVG